MLKQILDALRVRVLGVQTGKVSGASVSASSYADFEVNFDKAYEKAPIVLVGFQSTSSGSGMGGMSCSTYSTSRTGAKFRVFNADTSGRNPNLIWIAIGEIAD